MKLNRRTKIGIAATLLVGGGIALGTSCSSMTEQFNDAPLKYKNDAPAAVFSMPDGFANFAEKCDKSGNLILTTRDGNGGGKDVAILHVPDVCPAAGLPVGVPTR